MHQFASSLAIAFSGANLLFIIGGSLYGLVMGALAGISPGLAVVLLLIFTMQMSSTAALMLLGAVYFSAVAGGSISAILINIPGAPASIATTLDGYPMKRKGLAHKAIYLAFSSSMIGGLVGMGVLLLFGPPFAAFSLRFGPAEVFLVIMWALIVVALAGGGSFLKGLIGITIGLFVSSIGIAPVTATERFVFSPVLLGGINVIVALVGVFSIPEVLKLLYRPYVPKELLDMEPPRGRAIREALGSIVEAASFGRTQVISNIVGIIIGLVPGTGAQVAAPLAYELASRFSPNKRNFGTGIPEGVVAPETANNATVGPALVPLLTMGIPGSPTAAAMMGVLLIHGIVPGPRVYTQYADVVYPFIAGLFLAVFVTWALGIVLARPVSRLIASLPDHYLGIGVLILSVFGTYTLRNNLNDVIIMFVLGIMVFFLREAGVRSIAVILGLILGKIGERNFLEALTISKTHSGLMHYFLFDRPIAAVLLVMLIVTAVAGGFHEIRRSRLNSSGRSRDLKVVRIDVAVGAVAVLLAGCVFMFADLGKLHKAALFPEIYLAVMGISGVLLLAENFISMRSRMSSLLRGGVLVNGLQLKEVSSFLFVAAVIFLYVLYVSDGFLLTSFVVGVILPLIAQPKVAFGRMLLRNVLVSFGIVAVIAMVAIFLQISLPLSAPGAALLNAL